MANVMFTPTMIKKFKSELQNISYKNNSQSIEWAFVRWYVDSKFPGKDVLITEGKGDGGIDAIVKDERARLIYVIQSEFCHEIFKNPSRLPSPVSIKKILEFDGTVGNFEKNKEEFEKYLKTVREELRIPYRELYNRMRGSGERIKIIWKFITPHQENPDAVRRISNIPEEDYQVHFNYYENIFRLYEIELEGKRPTEVIELTADKVFQVDDKKFGVTTYIAQVFVKDFISYLEKYDPDLDIISANVRSFLKGSIINESIKQTYEKAPNEFWYGHNGITVMCDKVIRTGQRFKIRSPQVINGGQTLVTLLSSAEKNNAMVLLKLIEIKRDVPKEFVSNIILRTNQSNKIFTYDLKAHDPLQVNLAKSFIEYGIFYERRRGDWDKHRLKYKGYWCITSRDMAKILISSRPDLGGVRIGKKDIEELFQGTLYNKIFNVEFKEAFFKLQLFYLIDELLKDISYKRTEKSQRKSFNYTCFSLISECLETYKNIEEIIDHVLEDKNILYEKPFKNELKQIVKELFSMVWDKYLKVERKELMYITDFQKSPTYVDFMSKNFVPVIIKNTRKLFDELLIE